ncbi:MAG: UDP-4-amino-4,6-dideoxy-N-acetyl-beta-L-altrosamine transaminase [Patescibacteria group bacterium]|jgi:UDP-4-amino-4,6-dideoxy-N-acetyl-beta-L-altrosamine transaminase
MIPYGRQNLNKDDIDLVVKALKSDWLTQGPKILEFEKALAKYCGAKYAATVSSGTAALHLAYLTADFKKGDEVITTPNTFVATSNMLLAVHVKPVFCDIREDTYNIDESKIEKLITSKTKAIVPVHFAGHSCEMRKIKKIAKKYNLIIIEDACHALGGKYKNIKIGSCKFSDMAVFSFHAVKPITTGEGGAILTNNKKYYEKLISLRSHGIHKDKNGKNIMTALGYNYRITDFQAALGINQLKKLDFFIKKRKEVAAWYKKELSVLKEIILPQEKKDCYSGWHIYVIRVKNKKNKDGLMKYLRQNGIGVNFHYPAVYTHPYYQKIGYQNLRLKCVEEYNNTCVTLPCHTLLSRKDIGYIGELVKNYFKIK